MVILLAAPSTTSTTVVLVPASTSRAIEAIRGAGSELLD
jgi:hypothetical protein